MNHYPHWHLHIEESAPTAVGATHWPDSFGFPLRHNDPIFAVSMPKELLEPEHQWFARLNLQQMAQLFNPTVH
ncbi:hypothetical protein [Vibrio porteresiae]|uniref:Uncharacterized protein n=1 Tax=Vibrio porteresiae DSM 19223 TaxID=1123496 RepID=A0ABZ0QJF1_9VIBR|nr:hypothetical protein [Vibrio porteresiae]WPC76146.1 hypothetical protein R8Z52_24880 [Vibrio porteresiae DSM 19223]